MGHLLDYALHSNSNFNTKNKIVVLRDKSNQTVILSLITSEEMYV